MDEELYRLANEHSELGAEHTINTNININEGPNTCGRVMELKHDDKNGAVTYENVHDAIFLAVKKDNDSSESELEEVTVAEIEIIQEDGKLTYMRSKNVTQEMTLRKTNSIRYTKNEVGNDTELSKESQNDTKIKNRNARQKLQTDNRTKYDRLQSICIFCEKFVQNFSRHVIQNHYSEREVQKVLSYPKKSGERKRLLAALLKKGNYVLYTKKSVMKMKMHSLYNEYLPCTNCLGFYARKRLRNHRIVCTKKNAETFTRRTQSVIKQLKTNTNLKDTVVSSMRTDKISMIAKNDVLIKAYGSQILNTRKDRQFLNHATRKMRELCKLLEEVKRLDPDIEDFFSALKPKHYNTLVAATKHCANDKDERIHDSTYTVNVGAAIRRCCDIVSRGKIKSGNEVKDEIAELKTLMDRNWVNDVSSKENNLVPKKSSDITIVSLASDLKLLLEHLKRTAQEALAKLKQTKYNVAAFVDLTETIYCRMLLLNGLRHDILQSLPLDNYKPEDGQNNNECNETLTEKVLKKSLKQIVISSNKRPIRIFLQDDVLSDIEYSINIRKTYAEMGNPFLFAIPGCMTPIYGFKVMQRHAKLCNADPKAICSKIFKNHRAILTQIFNMSQRDIQHLANLMGHAYKSYKELPNDIYDAAKVSKLLILMEEGKADAYLGNDFDEIELDLYEKLIENDSDKVCDIKPDFKDSKVENDSDEAVCRRSKRRNNNKDDSKSLHLDTLVNKTKRILIPWTDEQKTVVLDYFRKHIRKCKPPKRAECDELKEMHEDLLSNKDWLKIKVFVQNAYTKK